jgi:hypothetical protein
MTPAAKRPPALLTLAANLPPVTTTLANKRQRRCICHRCQRYTRKTFVLESAEPDNDDEHVDRTAVERLQTHLEPRHGHGTIPHDVMNTYIFPPAMLCRANPD